MNGKLKVKSKEEKIKVIDLASKNIDELKQVLRINLSSNDQQTKAFSLFLVGKYHLVELAGDVNDSISMQDKNEYMKDPMWIWGPYPAVDALIEIGLPSVRYMIENLSEKNDKDVRRRSLEVMIGFSGHQDIELANFFLLRALKEENDPKKQKNLSDALNDLKIIEKEDAEDKDE